MFSAAAGKLSLLSSAEPTPITSSTPDRRRPAYPTYSCDICKTHPIAGIRWECDVCADFDVCNECYITEIVGKRTIHEEDHTFSKYVVAPVPPTPKYKQQTPKSNSSKPTKARNWKSCKLTLEREEVMTDTHKQFLQKIGEELDITFPNSWKNSECKTVLQGYEEALDAFLEHRNSFTRPGTEDSESKALKSVDEVHIPIRRAFIFCSVASTDLDFKPSYNDFYENIQHLKPSRRNIESMLAGNLRLYRFFDSFDIPQGTGYEEFQAWKNEKKIEGMEKELKEGRMWDDIIAPSGSTSRVHEVNAKVRRLFVNFYNRLGSLLTEVAKLAGKMSHVSRTAKARIEHGVKASCFIGFLFQTIVYRIRKHSIKFMWDVSIFPNRQNSGKINLGKIFSDFEGPFDLITGYGAESVSTGYSATQMKTGTHENTSNIVTVNVKRKKNSSANGHGRRKRSKSDASSVNEALREQEEVVVGSREDKAKIKELESQVALLCKTLNSTLQKVDRLTYFVETIAKNVLEPKPRAKTP